MVYFAIFLALYLTMTSDQLLLNSLLNITIHGWLAGVMLVRTSYHGKLTIFRYHILFFEGGRLCVAPMSPFLLLLQISVACRYPWAIQNAKEAAPHIAWDAPSFRAVVDHVAGVWGASQAITAALCVVSQRVIPVIPVVLASP